MATDLARGRGAAIDRIAPWLICGAFMAAAFALRTFDLAAYGFDTDEVFSVTAAQNTWREMFAIVADDKSHPPLHYIVLKLALDLGGVSETWGRLPSVLFGVGLVPVAYGICRQICLDRRDTAFVLCLVTVNSALIYYAQYARMFAALEFFAALSLWALIRLRRDASWGAWGVLTGVNVLMVYSHYWGWLMIVAQCLLMALAGRRRLWMMLLSAVSVVIAFLPWAILVAQAARRTGGLAGQISWMGTDVPGLIDYLWLIATFNGLITINGATVATRFGLIVFALPIAAAGKHVMAQRHLGNLFAPREPGFWIVLLVTPILLTSLGSYLAKQNLWGERHLSMLIVPYYILLGLAISTIKSQRLAGVIRVALLAWAVTSSASYLVRDDKKYHFESLADQIAAVAPAPVYVSEHFFIGLPLAYHLEKEGRDGPVVEERNLATIDKPRFWYVYRSVAWQGAAPELQFADRGYRIGARISMHWWQQTMTALLVEKTP
jgi:4-amino-4-deoxy-L-arabinose transferase-like glycosyltransferase